MDYYANEKGYLISLCKNRNTREFVGQIISRQYNGIILSSISFPTEYIQDFVNAGIPIVLLKNRYYNELEGVGKIDTGLYQGARNCIKYLISKGRKNILYLDRWSTRNHFSTMSDLRYRGFINEMEENGLEVTERNIITGCMDGEQVIKTIKNRIAEGFKIDGICARNDRLACLGLEAMNQVGYKVPEEVSVIGFDNSSISKYMVPKLTTMALNRKAIGRVAIEMLAQMIETHTTPDEVYIESHLIEREST